MCSQQALSRKSLYDSLAVITLSNGLESAWKSMELDDSIRAESVGRLVALFQPESILEVAAGYGFVTKYIQKYSPQAKITCLDIAAPFCEILRSKDYEVLEEDFITVQLDRTWNVVTIMQVLEHLENWQVLKDVLAKVASWSNNIVIVEIPEGGPIDGERHILSLTKERVCDVMREVGLTLSNVYCWNIPPQGNQVKNGYTAMVQIVGKK